MYALTVVKVDTEGTKLYPGTLFRAPAELFTNSQMGFYTRAPAGWSRCPLGFDVLSRVASGGQKIVLPGICLPDTERPKRNFPDYKLPFQRAGAEAFLNSIVDEVSRIEAARNDELSTLTHDLRALSTEIYHSAEAAKSSLISSTYGLALVQTDTVIAAQQMLSLRLDVVDYSTGKAFEQEPEHIPVYKKVDKIRKTFLPKAAVRSIDLKINGNSHGRAIGPPIFELIPFAVIENALKYSPDNIDINIDVVETLERVFTHVRSLGPRIHPEEAEKIFEKGYRGEDAKQSGQSGTGLGLYAAKSLAEHFGGVISANQDARQINVNGRNYYPTHFQFWVPRVS